jgi:Tfp pilus assembly protein PilV
MERQKRNPVHNRLRAISGLSLIELLVALVMGSIGVMALISLLISQNRMYSVQDDSAEMQQSLRVAMERISRDLRMAGFCRPWWADVNGNSGLSYSVAAPSNTLSIVGCLDAPAATLNTASSANATTITLHSGEGASFNTTTKEDICIEGKENARITGIASNTLTVDRNPGGGATDGLLYAYPANSRVYIVKWITYSVDAANDVLRIDEHQGAGAQPVANYISDMQTSISGRLITVTLTATARKSDRTTGLYRTTQLSNKIWLRNQ